MLGVAQLVEKSVSLSHSFSVGWDTRRLEAVLINNVIH